VARHVHPVPGGAGLACGSLAGGRTEVASFCVARPREDHGAMARGRRYPVRPCCAPRARRLRMDIVRCLPMLSVGPLTGRRTAGET
jgi:hypothetical protein